MKPAKDLKIGSFSQPASIGSRAEGLLLQFRAFLVAQQLTQKSIKNYVSDVRRFLASELEIGNDIETLDGILSRAQSYKSRLLAEGTPLSTINRHLASLRQFGAFVQTVHHAGKTLDVLHNVSVVPQAVRHDTSTRVLEQFGQMLEHAGHSESTVDNYVNDLKHYLEVTSSEMVFAGEFIKAQVDKYLKDQQTVGISGATLKRKAVSIRRFYAWAKSAEYIAKNPFETVVDQVVAKVSQAAKQFRPLAFFERFRIKNETTPDQAPLKGKTPFARLYNAYSRWPASSYIHLSVLVLFVALLGIFGYEQVFKNAKGSLAYPTALTPPNRILSFQGRLTDVAQTPIVVATNVKFRLFNDPVAGVGDGAALWASGTCSIDPDQDGIFSTLLGSSCGSAIPSSVFSENQGVYLEVEVSGETLTPRQQIATVAYALNSETLQGYPASASAVENTIPVFNNSGQLLIGLASPTIRSTSGTFAVQGNALTLSTNTGTNGAITIAPDGTGAVNVIGGTTTQDFINITNANLTTGTLIKATVGNNNTGYKFLSFLGGSSPEEKFSVNALGAVHTVESIRTPVATISATYSGATPLIINGTGGQIFSITNGGVATLNNLASGAVYSASGVISSEAQLSSARGGTGANLSAATQGSVPYFSATGVMSALAPTTSGYILTTQGAGANPIWSDPAVVAGASVYWTQANGALYPKNSSVDTLIGGTTTASAKFAFINVDSGNPTASISGNLAITSPAGATAANTFDILNGGSLNIQQSIGGNAGLTSRFIIAAGGNIGIGSTSPGSPVVIRTTVPDISTGTDLAVLGNMTSTTNSQFGARFTPAAVPSGASAVSYYGATFGASSSSLNMAGATLYGGETSPYFNGAGTLSQAIGLNAKTTVGVDGATITKSLGILVTGGVKSGCATCVITNQAGIAILDQTIATNNTNLLIGTSSVPTGNFSIYNSSSAINYFAGNVGIGTTAPTVALDIAGSASSSGTFSFRGTTDPKVDILNNENLGIRFSPGGNAGLSEKVTFLANGNLGIGSTTPTALLDIAGSASSSGTFAFRGTTDPKVDILNGENFGLRFSPGGDAGLSEKFTVLANGNVGINTTSPAMKLQVVTTAATGIREQMIKFNTTDAGNDAGYIGNATATDSTFVTTFSGYTDSLNTVAAFQLRAMTSAAQDASDTSTFGLIDVAAFRTDSATDPNNGNLTSIANRKLFTVRGGTAAGDVKLSILANGNVGIGSLTPTQILDVVGNFKLSGTTTFNGRTYTWPSAETVNYVLQTNGTGTLTWTDPALLSASSIYWTQANGALFPKNSTVDAFIGGQTTASAKFAFINVNSGNPTASISGNLAITSPAGATAANTFDILNGGSLNFRNSVGGNAGLASRLYISPSGSVGNIGINTSAPGAQLQVVTTAGSSVREQMIKFNTTDAGNDAGYIGNATSVDGSFVTTLSGYTDSSTTQGAFQLRGMTSSTNDSSDSSTFGLIDVAAFRTSSATDPNNGTLSSIANRKLFTVRGGTAVGDVKLSILANGNVGIGSLTPTAILDVVGSASTSGTLAFRGTTDPKVDILNNENLGLRFSPGGDAGLSEKVTFLANGNVGIGSTSPTALLNVVGGTARFQNGTGNAIAIVNDVSNVEIQGSGDDIFNLYTQGSYIFRVDTNNNGTDEFGFYNGGNSKIAAIDESGNLSVSGTTTFNSLAYTWPGSQSSGYVLLTNGSGTLSWADPAVLAGASVYWTQANGALFPKNSTVDAFIGGQTTASAKFAFLNVNSGTPVASISAGTNGATYITADGIVATTARQNLTLGGTNTGAVDFAPAGVSAMTVHQGGNVGIGLSGVPNGMLDVAGQVRIRNSSTALVFTGNSAAISFSSSTGTKQISTGGTTDLALMPGGNVGIGTTTPGSLLAVGATSQFTINSSGAISAATGITSSGNIIFSTFSTDGGLLYTNGSGQLSQITSQGSAGSCLVSNGAGAAPSFSTCVGQNDFWTLANGAIYPVNETVDLFVGGTSTSAAKFALINVNSGTPTASISGNLAIAAPTGSNPATSYNILNGGTFALRTSVGGNAGLATRLAVSNDGFVSIGTTTPDGSLSIKAYNASDSIASYYTSSNALVGRIGANGHTGIAGNSNTSYSLSVTGLSGVSAEIYGTSAEGTSGLLLNNSATGDPTVRFALSGTTTFAMGIDNSDGDKFKIGTTAIDTNTRFTIDSTGNVGIGTSNPSVPLQVGTTLLKVGANNQVNFHMGGNPPSDYMFYMTEDRASDGLFYIVGQDNGVIRLDTFSGNANIDNINSAGDLYIGRDMVGGGVIHLGDSDSVTALVIPVNGHANSGNVGIGSLAPGAKLDITGTLRASSTITFSALNCTGNANGGALTANGSGVISCSDDDTGATTTNYWQLNNKVLAPGNTTYDLAIGGESTATAKFQVFASTGNATTSGTLTFNSGTLGGNLIAATNKRGITLGDTSTGNIVIPSSNVGIGTTLPNSELNLVGVARFAQSTGVLPEINPRERMTLVTNNGTANYFVMGQSSVVTYGIANPASSTNMIIANEGSAIDFRTGVTYNGDWNVTGSQAFGLSGTTARAYGNFTVSGSTITLSTFSTAGGLLYTGGTGVMAQLTSQGSSGDCLRSLGGGAAPAFSACPGQADYWTIANGSIYPVNSTVDAFIGGTSTASAKFAFLNVLTGTPTASVSAGTNGAMYMTADGTLSTTAKQTLSLGGTNTGAVQIISGGTTALTASQSGMVTIPSVSSTGGLTIGDGVTGYLKLGNGLVYSNGSELWISPPNANLVVINGDILVGGNEIEDSDGTKLIQFNNASNYTMFNNGNVGIGSTTPRELLDIGGNSTTSGTFTFNGAALANNTIAARNMRGIIIGDTETGNINFNGGNVGIGTLTPESKLYIKENINAARTGVAVRNTDQKLSLTSYYESGIAQYSVIQSSNNAGVGTGNVLSMQPDGGYIGVGTTVPRATFDIRQNSGTIAIASVSGRTSHSALVVDNSLGDILSASASGATRFVVQQNGNVGINTTMPSAKLDIFSAAPSDYTEIRGTAFGVSALTNRTFFIGRSARGTKTSPAAVQQGDALMTLGGQGYDSTSGFSLAVPAQISFLADETFSSTSQATYMSFHTTATAANNAPERMRLTSVGNLGIGTTTVNEKLEVIGKVRIDNTGGGNAGCLSYSGTELQYSDDCASFTSFSALVSGSAGGWTDDGTVVRLTTATDNVGIGTTNTSTSKLYVQGSSSVLTTQESTNGETSHIWKNHLGISIMGLAGTAGNGITGVTQPGDLFISNRTGGRIQFSSDNANSEAHLSINEPGNVGVGTSSGTAKFHVLSSNVGGSVRIQNSNASGWSAIDFLSSTASIPTNFGYGNSSASAFGSLAYWNTATGVSLTIATADTQRMRIDSNGNIGIGTTAPVGGLEVNKEQVGKALLILDQDGTQNIIAASASGTTKLVLTAAGNLGIGTTTTTQMLTVAGSADFSNPSGITKLSLGGISEIQDNNLGDMDFEGNRYFFDSTDVFYWRDVDSAYANRMTLDSATGILTLSALNCTGNANGGALTANGSGVISCSDDDSAAGGTNYWQLNNKIIAPGNTTHDLAIGGESTAAAKFQVFGATGNATTSGTLTFNSGTLGGNLIAATKKQGLTIGDTNTGNIILNGGNVGIGTTVPVSLLNVYGTSPVRILGSTSTLAGTESVDFFWKNSSTNDLGGLRIQRQASGNIDSSIYSALSGNAAAEVLRVGGQGNIGINTTTPLAALDVRINTSLTSLVGGTGPSASISGKTSFAGLVVDNSGVGDLFTASASGAHRFVIRQNGNVGIGTNLPSFKLQVAGSIGPTTDNTYDLGSSPSARFRKLFLGPGSLHVSCTTGDGCAQEVSWDVGANTTTGALTIGANGNPSAPNAYLSITQGGNIGVGTTTPGTLFAVGSSSQFSVNSTGNVVMTGTTTLPNTNTITGVANYTQFSNGISVGGATTYYVNSSGNANFNTLTVASTPTFTSLSNGVAYINSNQLTTETTLSAVRGGTGANLSAAAQGAVPYFSGAGVMSALAAGTNGYILMTQGAGANPIWTDPAIVTGSSVYWTQANGALIPKNSTVDALIGGQSTISAKFAFLNVNTGVPVASVSAGTAGATYLTADGILATTARQTLTLGGTNTGAIDIAPTGVSALTVHQDGNVGIGLSGMPNGMLDVGGQVRIRNSSTALVFTGNSAAISFSSSTGTKQLTTGGTTDLALMPGGNVGIGTTTPGSLLAVGATSQFTINSSGAITAATGITSSGTIQFSGLNCTGNANGGALTADGSGVVSCSDDESGGAGGTNYWQQGGSGVLLAPGNVTQDLTIGGNSTASAKFQVFGLTGNVAMTSSNITGTTTGSGLVASFNALTTGTGGYFSSSSISTGSLLSLASTSNAQTSASLLSLDWSPSVASTGSGNLVNINLGANADHTGNLFNVADNGSSLFSVSTSSITSAVPHAFTAPGDVSIAYDLQFTNQTAAYIKSYGPLVVESGESYENNDLTLKTYGAGNALVDLTGTGNMTLRGTDTAMVFDTRTEVDTNYWMGVLDDAGGDDDDAFQIGKGTVVGTTPYVTVASTGNVGIGSTSPRATFDLNGSFATSNVYASAAATTATVTVSTAGVVYELFKDTGTTDTATTTTYNITGVPTVNGTILYVYSYVRKSATAGARIETLTVQINGTQVSTVATASTASTATVYENYFAIRSNGSWKIVSLSALQTGAADVAEYIPGDADIEPGMIVANHPTLAEYAVKASDTNKQSMLGVISTNGHMINDNDMGNLPLALAGRVPTFVTTANGPIQIGDAITASSVPGYGVKAVKAGRIVGTAIASTSSLSLGEFNSALCPISAQGLLDPQGNPVKCGLVLTFLAPTWYDPDVLITSDAEYELVAQQGGGYAVVDENGSMTDRISTFATSVIGKVRAGTISAKDTITDTLNVGGQSINDLITQIANSVYDSRGGAITPVANVDTLNAGNINTASIAATSSADIAIRLDQNLISIQNTTDAQNPTTVAQFDTAGNATFSGEVNAQSARISTLEAEQAHVDTLSVDSLSAGTIEGLDAQIADIARSMIDDATASGAITYQPPQDMADLINSLLPANDASTEAILSQLNAQTGKSLTLADVSTPNVAIVEDLLSVRGLANFTYAEFNNALTVGSSLTLTANSIETPTNTTLYVQPSGSGSVNFLAGVMTLDPSGLAMINGSLYVSDSIYSKDIHTASVQVSPFDEMTGLPVQPASTSGGLSKLLALYDENGNVVSSIDASGSAAIRELIIAAPGATSSGAIASSTTSNSTAGTSTIPAGQTEITITNPNVALNTLVYLTPITNTSNQVLYVKTKTNGQGFTVAMNAALGHDVTFNYWLIKVSE